MKKNPSENGKKYLFASNCRFSSLVRIRFSTDGTGCVLNWRTTVNRLNWRALWVYLSSASVGDCLNQLAKVIEWQPPTRAGRLEQNESFWKSS